MNWILDHVTVWPRYLFGCFQSFCVFGSPDHMGLLNINNIILMYYVELSVSLWMCSVHSCMDRLWWQLAQTHGMGFNSIRVPQGSVPGRLLYICKQPTWPGSSRPSKHGFTNILMKFRFTSHATLQMDYKEIDWLINCVSTTREIEAEVQNWISQNRLRLNPS